MDYEPTSKLPAPVVAIAGFIFPGLGYALIGEKVRALVAGTTIVLLFIAGILIGGIRVIDVPGYYVNNQNGKIVETWKLQSNPVGEVLNRPWYMAQILTGPINLVASYVSIQATARIDPIKQSTSRIFDIGTLYTAVAGMLNLLIVLDSIGRAGDPKQGEEETGDAQ